MATEVVKSEQHLREQVELVHRLRLDEAMAKEQVTVLRAEFEASIARQVEQAQLCTSDRAEQESRLREMAYRTQQERTQAADRQAVQRG